MSAAPRLQVFSMTYRQQVREVIWLGGGELEKGWPRSSFDELGTSEGANGKPHMTTGRVAKRGGLL